MFKLLSYFVGLGGLMLSLASCYKNPSLIYEGATLVEFKNPRAGFATQPTSNVSNGIRARTIRQGIGRDSVLVQLVGPQRSTPTTVGYLIAGTTTAVDGTNYSVVGTKGSVTIPANSSSAYVVFQFLNGIPAAAPATQTVNLAMTLTGSDNTPPSENYKTFTYTIRN